MTPQTAPTADAPALPYEVKEYPYGLGRMMPTKVYADRVGGDVLTPEELQMWACVQHLTAERDALREENARLRADLDAATAPSEGNRKRR